jgi:adenylate cyclase
MSYTAMGDGVNLAARLESLNKQYGTLMLVSTEVEREARVAFDFRHLDRVAVKGKRLGVEVYELLGPKGAGPRPEAVTRYERALDAYLERRFDEALGLLGEVPLDRPGEVLASRCRRHLAAPPPAGWDGVFVAQEK